MQISTAQMNPEMESLKARLKTTWMSGDYGTFAKPLEAGALEFLQRLAIPAGTRMLDVGCGAGQIAIPAVRAGVHVTGADKPNRKGETNATTNRFAARTAGTVDRLLEPTESNLECHLGSGEF